jgi:hypothetical protein
MQKKNWITIGIITLLLASSLVALYGHTPGQKQSDADSTCCIKEKKCVEKPRPSGEVLPENLSRQFIFILPLVN